MDEAVLRRSYHLRLGCGPLFLIWAFFVFLKYVVWALRIALAAIIAILMALVGAIIMLFRRVPHS